MIALKLPLVCIVSGFFVGAIADAKYGSIITAPTQSETRAVPVVIPMAPPTFRTLSWFQSNQAEMRQKLAACSDNPGVAAHDPECENALGASDHIAIDRMLK